jgi:hypothetical protein
VSCAVARREPDGVALPEPNPISARWLGRGTPLDLITTWEGDCLVCHASVTYDRYVVMLGRHGGFGVPFPFHRLLTRRSTRAKIGRRSHWDLCRRCTTMLPLDDEARAQAARLGRPDGFIGDPP